MAYSMTGFGTGTGSYQGVAMEVQAKTLNSRGLDIRINMDEMENNLEVLFTKLIKQFVARGRVELTIVLKRSEGSATGFNLELFERRVQAVETLFGGDWSLRRCMEFCINQPEVWRDSRRQKFDPELSAAIIETARIALEHVTVVRRQEGKALKEYMLDALESLETSRQNAKERAPERINEFRQRLMERVGTLQTETGAVFDVRQLEGEVALLADKLDITEELTRIGAHLSALRIMVLTNTDPLTCIGKKIDFYLQELGREATTIASKSRDTILTRHTIDMRTTIESMREQAANLQ
ncbi:MAG: DUF1732 domain-containing protein [Proteobacteria bacterium]|nr:DUF1732 domain-containing protein [Pseudomonadota bacterium]